MISYKWVFEVLAQECNKLKFSFNPIEISKSYPFSSIKWLARNYSYRMSFPSYAILVPKNTGTRIKQRVLRCKFRIGKMIALHLLLLNPSEVGDCYALDLAPIQPQHRKVRKFADYLVDHYLIEDSTFPPSLWASASSSPMRTTNYCESFHSHFNSSFNAAHPSLFYFISVLLNYQNEIYIKIQSTGLISGSKNAVTKRKQEFIENKLTDYTNGVIQNRLQFITIVTHYFSHK